MCIQPIIIKRKQIGSSINLINQPVPCGKCPKCAQTKIQQWTFRLKQELKISTSAYFVTLTYSDDNLTYGDTMPTLVKKDFQDFMKRLRYYDTGKIVYYAVGEYGSKTHRPHYHAILLNVDNPENIPKAWQLGFTYAPPLASIDGIGYVLKYISKPKNKITGKQPEFSLMSKGIGKNYLTQAVKRYHSQTQNCYINDNGYNKSMPKYYKDKLYNTEQRSETTLYLKNRAKERNEQYISKMLKKYPTKSVNEVLNIIERRKHILKFDPRQEVL